MDASTVYNILPGIFPFPLSFLASKDVMGQKLFNETYAVFFKQRITPIIAFAHLTGWSAELIANKINKRCDTKITPEMVWDIYKAWEAAWDEKKLGSNYFSKIGKEFQSFLQVLLDYGYLPNFEARCLSKTPRPITIQHIAIWRPIPYVPVIDGESYEIRMDALAELEGRKDQKTMAGITAAELSILCKAGGEVLTIIETILTLWVEHMEAIIPNMPFTRKISEYPEEASQVSQYVEKFRLGWEAKFGKMDDAGNNNVETVDGIPHIEMRSTGSAAKWYFMRMMTIRLSAMEILRAQDRQETGYVEVALEDLPKDVSDCSICLQRLGVPGPDGVTEKPVRLVACCGNYIGLECITEWYKGYENEKCPICRQARLSQHSHFSIEKATVTNILPDDTM